MAKRVSQDRKATLQTNHAQFTCTLKKCKNCFVKVGTSNRRYLSIDLLFQKTRSSVSKNRRYISIDLPFQKTSSSVSAVTSHSNSKVDPGRSAASFFLQ